MSTPAFITLLLASVCSVYIIQVAANLPRYLEIHFRLSASTANVMAGKFYLAHCSGGTGMTLGELLSCCNSSERK